MPVRTIKPHGSSVTGWFPSVKMQRMVAFESTLERDALYLLDFDPCIVSFEEQPLRIAYEHEGKARHYTPDFHAVRRSASGSGSSSAEWHELIECKPERFVDSEENQRKFQAARRRCHECGWEFTVLTESHLRSGFRLHNVKQFALHARCVVDDLLRLAVIEALSAESPIALGTLVVRAQATSSKPAHEQILALAFHHVLHMPLDEAPLSLSTPVSPTPMPIRAEVLP